MSAVGGNSGAAGWETGHTAADKCCLCLACLRQTAQKLSDYARILHGGGWVGDERGSVESQLILTDLWSVELQMKVKWSFHKEIAITEKIKERADWLA